MTLLQFDTYHSDRSDHVGRGVGPVVISIEEDARGGTRRPTAAWGIVISAPQVKGRKAPPGPLTGTDTGVGPGRSRPHLCPGTRRAERSREHRPAVGVLPEHGTWRQMEAAVAAAARSSTVFYRVELVYTGGGRRGFPARFKSWLTRWNADQVAAFVAAPTTYCPRVVSTSSSTARHSTEPMARRSAGIRTAGTRTPEMFSAHMGKKDRDSVALMHA